MGRIPLEARIKPADEIDPFQKTNDCRSKPHRISFKKFPSLSAVGAGFDRPEPLRFDIHNPKDSLRRRLIPLKNILSVRPYPSPQGWSP